MGFQRLTEYSGKGSFVMDQVRGRFKHNKNWLAVFVGDTGSGKSYSALTVAKLLDPSFNVDRVVWSTKDFVSLLNTDTLHSGQFLIFDEAGAGIPSREWFSQSNRVINLILQTFRHEGIGVIFTVPTASFIDKQARKLFHAQIEMVGINYGNKRATALWRLLAADLRKDHIYYLMPRYKGPEGYTAVKTVTIPFPPTKLVEAYERRKKEYAISLRRELEKDLDDSKLEAKAKITKLRKKVAVLDPGGIK